MDLTKLSDEELDAHRLDVLNEKERRAALETIPGQIRDLTEKYVAGGGDPKDLKTTD